MSEEDRIRESGQLTLGGNQKGKIHLLSIIGEIEGHENLSGSTKTTKYELCCRNLLRWRTMGKSKASWR